MKHFKLRTDLTIKVGEKTLYRIEATKDIERFGVKAGDLAARSLLNTLKSDAVRWSDLCQFEFY